MPMSRAILLMVFGLLSPLSCFAQQPVVGTYKLVSYVTIIDGEIREALGKDPRGYLVLTPTRCFVLMTAEHQKIGQPVAVRAALWDSIVSYSGPYRLEGNKIVISNEASSNEIGNGINYSRNWEIKKHQLVMTTVPSPYSPDALKTGIARVIWERLD